MISVSYRLKTEFILIIFVERFFFKHARIQAINSLLEKEKVVKYRACQ